MRLVQNEKRIARRRKVGEIAPFAGLLLLGVSTILVFTRQDLIVVSMVLVMVSLMLSLTGSYLGSRYVGVAAPYLKVPQALKGLDDQYSLMMYTTPVPFLLLDPGGLTVLSIKSQDGTIRFADGKWHLDQKMGALRRFAGQEGLGQPEEMLRAEIASVESWLAKALPEGVDVPLRGVLLLTHPDVKLEVDGEPPIPVLRIKTLKRWLRKNGKRSKLSDESRKALAGVLGLDN